MTTGRINQVPTVWCCFVIEYSNKAREKEREMDRVMGPVWCGAVLRRHATHPPLYLPTPLPLYPLPTYPTMRHTTLFIYVEYKRERERDREREIDLSFSIISLSLSLILRREIFRVVFSWYNVCVRERETLSLSLSLFLSISL